MIRSKHMELNDKRNWKIIYSNYTGMEKKAVELVYTELGSYILRDSGQYALYVLPCEKVGEAVVDKNSVIIGTYDENKLVREYVNEEEIPKDGYVVKVCDAKNKEGLKVAVITAKHPTEVFYGAIDFVDDYSTATSMIDSGIMLMNRLFDPTLGPFPDYYSAKAPTIKRRTLFAWGHPINDYRGYIENMARLKLNQLVLWNDFVPINAKDLIDYAHEYGIQVIWGYSWGWVTRCWEFDPENIPLVQQKALETFEKQYAPLGVDGIYFQSFTENTGERIKGKLVAEMVTDFVNDTASKLLEKHPNIYIIFGLHAKSVRDRLPFIKNVDKRVEIMWEDCGAFPYSYIPEAPDRQSFEETKSFTEDIINLRGIAPTSLLIRGVATLSWISFAHQAGPYVIGKNHKSVIEHDKAIMRPIWRTLEAQWRKGRAGKYAYDMIKHVASLGRPDVAVGMAGQFVGGIWQNEALIAEMLWNSDESYDEILERVLRRRYIEET